ncbi:MAG: nitrous oxide reductase family maturation protein NosD [Candidatus Hodarchaeota archaeon]
MIKSSKFYCSIFILLIFFSNTAILCHLYLEPQNNQKRIPDKINLLKTSAIWASLNLTNAYEVNETKFYAGTSMPIKGKVFNRITGEPNPNINVSIFANGKLYNEFNDTTDSEGDFEINFIIPLTIKSNTQIEIWGNVTDILPGDIEYLNHYEITVLSNLWNLTGTSIFIDDTNPNYNWSKTAQENDWCSGSGIVNDPYIIQNVLITGGTASDFVVIQNSDAYFTIKNCIICNVPQGFGTRAAIKLVNTKNGNINNNNLSYNARSGVALINSQNITIFKNIGMDNLQSGISLTESKFINIISNTFNNEIYIENSNNSIIENNKISNKYSRHDGLNIYPDSSNNLILNNSFQNCGIYFQGYSDKFSLQHLLTYTIDSNNSINGKPIYFYSNQESLSNNNVTNAGQVILINCSRTYFTNLNVSYGSVGLTLFYCNNSIIENITSSHNQRHGIYLYYTNYTSFTRSIIDGNTEAGIHLYSCNKVNFINNSVINNVGPGIGLYHSHFSYISNSTVINDETSGIMVFSSDNNTIVNNLIRDNGWDDIHIREGSNDNLIYKNNFLSLNQNVRDECSNNKWDNGSIGNYWIYYTGFDVDDNGIGDTPYNIPGPGGSKDNYPIWDDGPHVIIIYSPEPGDIFGITAPNFNLSIIFPIFNTSWYTLDNGLTNCIFNGSSGIINQNIWEDWEDGPIAIKFYVNNTAGSFKYAEVLVFKDTTAPSIIIDTPMNGSIYGEIAPIFNFTVYDSHSIHSSWYIINNTITKYFFTSILGRNLLQINQSIWDTLPEGQVLITFFINDTIGNINLKEIMLYKQLTLKPEVIPGYNYFVVLGTMIILTFYLQKKRNKKIIK